MVTSWTADLGGAGGGNEANNWVAHTHRASAQSAMTSIGVFDHRRRTRKRSMATKVSSERALMAADGARCEGLAISPKGGYVSSSWR